MKTRSHFETGAQKKKRLFQAAFSLVIRPPFLKTNLTGVRHIQYITVNKAIYVPEKNKKT
ncbi:hypothetical protein B9H02_03700 [Prosthecochloris sp. HL-130-GSB]|nr:hypothetical protein B9H02_03700 [Prosthecochloris sp. HL-130-GSB]